MVIAVRTPACAWNDQYTQPVAALSAYTKPVSAPAYTRPPATVGCPYIEVAFGKPKAHFSFSFGTWSALRPAAEAG